MQHRFNKMLSIHVIAVLLVTLLLISCGNNSDQLYTGQQDLQKFADKLTSLNIYKEQGLVLMSAWAGETSVYLQLRKREDFVKPVMEPQLSELKDTIFKAVGFRVPLELSIYTIDEEPHMIGRLTAMDGDRLLIVSGNGQTGSSQGMPEALWFRMAEDAMIMKEGNRISAQELQIGSDVRGWHSGLVAESYPGQTEGLKIVVSGLGTAETGELDGILEEISYGHEDGSQNFIVVNGKKHGLLGSTLVRIGEKKGAAADLKAGDRVLLWFAGYNVGMENELRMVTQIAAQR